MFLPEVQCAVFDLDDTLFLERDYVRSGFTAVGNWARENLGLEGLTAQALSLFEQGSRCTIFDAALAKLGYPATPELIQKMVTIYRGHEPSIALLPDARRCLERLRAGGIRLGLITDGCLESQQNKISALGLRPIMHLVICTAALGGPQFSKPHPLAFELMEREWQRPGPHFLYVGDNPAKDFTAPSQRGWHTVRCRRRHGLHYHRGNPAHGGPDREIDELLALPISLLSTRYEVTRHG